MIPLDTEDRLDQEEAEGGELATVEFPTDNPHVRVRTLLPCFPAAKPKGPPSGVPTGEGTIQGSQPGLIRLMDSLRLLFNAEAPGEMPGRYLWENVETPGLWDLLADVELIFARLTDEDWLREKDRLFEGMFEEKRGS